jgi:hypothetical protein
MSPEALSARVRALETRSRVLAVLLAVVVAGCICTASLRAADDDAPSVVRHHGTLIIDRLEIAGPGGTIELASGDKGAFIRFRDRKQTDRLTMFVDEKNALVEIGNTESGACVVMNGSSDVKEIGGTIRIAVDDEDRWTAQATRVATRSHLYSADRKAWMSQRVEGDDLTFSMTDAGERPRVLLNVEDGAASQTLYDREGLLRSRLSVRDGEPKFELIGKGGRPLTLSPGEKK